MAMIYPMFALVVLTFVVGLGLGVARKMSVRRGEVKASFYRLMDQGEPPEYVQKLARNFSNLLEVPVLFYVIGTIAIATGMSNPLMSSLAWVYVFLRWVHSLIHITYNYPPHRFLAFLASGLVLMAMWIHVVVAAESKV